MRTPAHLVLAALIALVAATQPGPIMAQNTLTYYGGPVVSNAEIVVVSWGPPDSTVQSVLPSFYTGISTSTYWNIFSEYSTTGLNGADGQPGSNQRVGQGSYRGLFQITASVTATTVTTAQVGQELAAQITATQLPAPTFDAAGNVNTVYLVYFPSGITINDPQAGLSCNLYAILNEIFTYNGNQGPLGIVPFLGPTGPCGRLYSVGTSYVNILSAYSSLLIANIVTDPQVALVSGNVAARPIAWYNNTNGQLGNPSICGNPVTDTFPNGSSFEVFKLWSN